MRQQLLIIAGPTAVGKTAFSIDLAKKLDGEIISADSMQVYKGMDIGTAKIRKDEMCGVSHHLIDEYKPDEEFNVTLFQKRTKELIQSISSRGKLPIIVGGTGFYIQSVLYDIDFTEENNDYQYREELEYLAEKKGVSILHHMLKEVDPESAKCMHENNVKKVIRALEYYHLTGKRISEHNEKERKKQSPYSFIYFVLTMNRSELYKRIDLRVEKMLDDGLVEEVRSLKEHGYCRGMTSMEGLGYKEILDYLDGKCTLEEAIYILKRQTRHFAKRQLTWFKRERGATWLLIEDFGSKAEMLDIAVEKWNMAVQRPERVKK